MTELAKNTPLRQSIFASVRTFFFSNCAPLIRMRGHMYFTYVLLQFIVKFHRHLYFNAHIYAQNYQYLKVIKPSFKGTVQRDGSGRN